MTNWLQISIDRGWLPDFLPFEMPEGGLKVATNVLPYDEYYAPALDYVAYSSNVVSGTPLSGQQFRANDNQRYVFVGTDTKLYRLEPSKSLTDVTRVSGGDYTSGDNRWYFEQFGEYIIATDFIDVPQILKPNLASANFQALGGSPPKSKYLLLHKSHLIHAYVDEGGTINPKKVVWSAREDVEDYTPSLTTGADSQVLADAAGEITGIAAVGGLFAIFHENSISLAWYSGAQFTYNFATNKVKNIGAISGTIISVGEMAYFWDDRDIYRFDGVEARSIGEGVRNTVLSSINIAYPHRITTAHDVRKGIIFWAYPSTASTDGTPDKLLCYNYRKNRFALVELDLECIFAMHKFANESNIDAWDAMYASMDTDVPFHMDSNFWFANAPGVGAVNSTAKVGTLSGVALTGTIETREIKAPNDRVTMVRRVRPKADNPVTAIQAAIGSRFKEADTMTYSPNSTVGSTGYANVRRSGRFLSCKLTTGQHDGLNGIEIEVAPAGER